MYLSKIKKTTISCGISCIFWFSKIINNVFRFFETIYNEYDCIKDVVDKTAYYSTYTYNTIKNRRCEPFTNTWISSNIVDTKKVPYKLIEKYTTLKDFDVDRLHSYFIMFLNNKKFIEKNEIVILKGYDTVRDRKFYVCRQPPNKVHIEYILKYSSIHFLSVIYREPTMNESVPLIIDKEWFIVGNEILGYTHIFRMLNYHTMPYEFSMDYVLEIIDSNIKMFELHSDEFIRIGEDSYTVEKINLDSDKDSSGPVEF